MTSRQTVVIWLAETVEGNRVQTISVQHRATCTEWCSWYRKIPSLHDPRLWNCRTAKWKIGYQTKLLCTQTAKELPQIPLKLYSKQLITYNVHGLTNLLFVAKRPDSLDNCSAYRFENCLHPIQKLVNSTEHPIVQIANRLRKSEHVCMEENTSST